MFRTTKSKLISGVALATVAAAAALAAGGAWFAGAGGVRAQIMKRRAIVLTAAVALLLGAGKAGGGPALASPQSAKGALPTIVVPRDFPTIQAAVDAAAP